LTRRLNSGNRTPPPCDTCGAAATLVSRDFPLYACDQHRAELLAAIRHRWGHDDDYESEGERYAKSRFGGRGWGL
jgi:hypothetical protein